MMFVCWTVLSGCRLAKEGAEAYTADRLLLPLSQMTTSRVQKSMAETILSSTPRSQMTTLRVPKSLSRTLPPSPQTQRRWQEPQVCTTTAPPLAAATPMITALP